MIYALGLLTNKTYHYKYWSNDKIIQTIMQLFLGVFLKQIGCSFYF